MWDKTADDIQSAVALSGTAVSGESKYVEDWTSAGFDMSEGHHFLTLHLKGVSNNSGTSGVTLEAECVPSQGQSTGSFNDDDAVFQLADDGSTTGIKVTISKDGAEDEVVTFDISSVTLEDAPEAGE